MIDRDAVFKQLVKAASDFHRAPSSHNEARLAKVLGQIELSALEGAEPQPERLVDFEGVTLLRGGIFAMDPGAKGTAAYIDPNGSPYFWKFAGRDLPQLCELVETVAPLARMCLLELVGPARKEGRVQGVSSTWKFSAGNAHLEAFLTAARVRWEKVAPTRWQKPFRLPTAKAAGSPGKKKAVHKARAKELFPRLKGITNDTADGLLIAEYGVRTFPIAGQPAPKPIAAPAPAPDPWAAAPTTAWGTS